MVVVFPAPAGAIASCSRAPEVAIPVTRAACPALRVTPFAACSNSATPTASALAVCPSHRPAASTSRCSAARIAAEVYRVDPATSYTLRPVLAAQRGRLDEVVLGLGDPDGAGGQDLVDDQVHDSLDLPGGQVHRPDPALRLGPHVPDLPRRPRALQRGQDRVVRWPAPTPRPPPTRAFLVPGERAAATIAVNPPGPPRTSSASRRHVVRCSARVRGSCLASRVSRVACCASAMDSTTVGGRPCSAWKARASWPRRTSMVARRVDHRWFRAGSTPTISRTGRLPRCGVLALREHHAEAGVQVLLDGGVVGLGGGDVGLEQHPPVNGQPLPGQWSAPCWRRRRGCAGRGPRRGSRGG